jgi:hypothetical protein
VTSSRNGRRQDSRERAPHLPAGPVMFRRTRQPGPSSAARTMSRNSRASSSGRSRRRTMATELFANNASTALTVAVATTPAAGTSETWTVTSTAAPFPQPSSGVSQFRATVGPSTDTSPEIVIVTAVPSGTTWTVSRGAEGSAIKTHAIGDPVTMTFTAANTYQQQTVFCTSSGSVVVPLWATVAELLVVGAGGSGGGAGSASSAIAQGGGGGGAAGTSIRKTQAITGGITLTVTIGAPGTSGVGGASGGNAGTAGASGGNSSVTGTGVAVVAGGGYPGGSTAANTTALGTGGPFSWAVSGSPAGTGGGGGVRTGGCTEAGIWGGGGGGSSSATLGGGGGNAYPTVTLNIYILAGVSGSSGTTAGLAGTAAPANSGCGGGGGGGGANGGAGGNGAAGGSGFVTLTFKSL